MRFLLTHFLAFPYFRKRNFQLLDLPHPHFLLHFTLFLLHININILQTVLFTFFKVSRNKHRIFIMKHMVFLLITFYIITLVTSQFLTPEEEWAYKLVSQANKKY